MSPNLPLNLVSANSNSQQQQPPLAVVIPQAPTPIFNPPSSTANQIVLDSNPTGLCQNPVPLVKKKQPTAVASDTDRNSLVITEDQQPYPPPSQSPLFLQQPNSPNPKHINNSSALQVETGTLGKSRTTRIYLDGRVLKTIIKPRPSFGYFSMYCGIYK